jgi:hypothetical protein
VRRGLAALGIAVALSASACGGRSGEPVSAGEQRALPAQQGAADRELCSTAPTWAERRAERAQGRAHLKAIERSHALHPDALVTTRYYASETAELKTEQLTVNELAAQWLRSLRYGRCDPEAQARLNALPGVLARSRSFVP